MDELCPKHGKLRVRGRYFEGYVEKIVGSRAVVTWERIRYDQKYERYFRTQSKAHAHIPACMTVEKGNLVKIGECRPISKITHFAVVEVIKK